MNLAQLIFRLQRLLEMYGDLPVLIVDQEFGMVSLVSVDVGDPDDSGYLEEERLEHVGQHIALST